MIDLELTYLGGTSDEEGLAIAATSSENAYITGYTKSTDFPVLDAIQASKGAEACSAPLCEDAFVTKLDASGSALVYSTYLGGSGDDQGNGIALDGNGGVYVVGEGNSADFPVTPGGFDTTLNGTKDDVFIVKLGEAAPPPLTWTTTYTYTYDHANRLISITNPQSTISNGYNGLGDRLQQTVDSIATNYTLDLNNWLTQALGDDTKTYLYGTARIAQDDASGADYFLGDALGSVKQLVDATGAIEMAKIYEPFGDVLNDAGSVATSYGFTGEWTDATGLIYLRARYYEPGQGRFSTRDPWTGNFHQPNTLSPYLYGLGNPINLLDPSGMWTCRGHQDCNAWVKNVLGILSQTGQTGRAIVEFFHEHDDRIRKTQPGGYFDPSCRDLPFLSDGVLIEFGTPWPGPSWGTAIFIDTLQLANDSRVINGPNPEGFGLQLFGHEVSHWAQGSVRLTIQGELLARYVEKQLRNDLKPQYGEIRESEKTDTLVTRFNPFYHEHLREAKDWMIANWGFGYAMLPLPSVGGLDQSWLDRFYVRVELPYPPLGPSPVPTPPPPIGTPVPPPIGTPAPPLIP